MSGRKWIENFFEKLTDEQKKEVKVVKSEKVYKFGGGERRKSLGKIVFPCNIGNMNVKISTEIVEADFPLLIGNSMLKKADAVLYPNKQRIVMMGEEIGMRETKSGHFSLKVKPPEQGQEFLQKTTDVDCMICEAKKDRGLTLKDIDKLHQYFGHTSRVKLESLIKNANKLNNDVKEHREKVY